MTMVSEFWVTRYLGPIIDTYSHKKLSFKFLLVSLLNHKNVIDDSNSSLSFIHGELSNHEFRSTALDSQFESHQTDGQDYRVPVTLPGQTVVHVTLGVSTVEVGVGWRVSKRD